MKLGGKFRIWKKIQKFSTSTVEKVTKID